MSCLVDRFIISEMTSLYRLTSTKIISIHQIIKSERLETTSGGDISTYKKFDRVAPVELNSEVPPVVTLAVAYGVGELQSDIAVAVTATLTI